MGDTLEVDFCLEALEEALSIGTPEIFNSDQGSQSTSPLFTGRPEGEGIRISVEGRGRVLFGGHFTSEEGRDGILYTGAAFSGGAHVSRTHIAYLFYTYEEFWVF